MIGKILNSRYHIISQLGQGSFGATFIAEDRWQNQKHCVIKQLKPDVLSPATQYLFEKEAEIGSPLKTMKKLKLTQRNRNMKAYEFPAKVTGKGKLKSPDAILKSSK